MTATGILPAEANGGNVRRQVFFEPTGKLHPSFRYLLDFPPAGYEYRLPSGWWKALLRPLERTDVIYHNLWRLSPYVPLMLVKSKLDGVFQKPPPRTVLTFAISHVVTRDEPWVLFAEWVHMLVGWDIHKLREQKENLERLLASPNCRKILTWCEPARQSFLHHLDCSQFADKIDVLPLAAPSRKFTRSFREDRVRLLFVGSAHASTGLAARLGTKGDVYDFHIKGGKEVLAAFARLRSRYPFLELTMRAAVPAAYRRAYARLPGVRFLVQRLSWQELEQEFLSADIYVFPCHQTPPWGSILDAMSFELPVVTTDVYSNDELVEDGVTGFLVKPSSLVNYYDPDEPYMPPMNTTPRRREEFLRAIQQVDEGTVNDLVEKLSTLVEDADLRRRMGRSARWEVDEGSHSIQHRNRKLKAIYDEATG